jgi:hypothetical protein
VFQVNPFFNIFDRSREDKKVTPSRYCRSIHQVKPLDNQPFTSDLPFVLQPLLLGCASKVGPFYS